jgi:hypothetical protein
MLEKKNRRRNKKKKIKPPPLLFIRAPQNFLELQGNDHNS